MNSTTMTIRLPGDVRDKLDRIGEATRRSRSFLAAEAVTAYVARELEIIEGIQRGLADMEAGRTVPHEAVMEKARKIIADARRKQAERQ